LRVLSVKGDISTAISEWCILNLVTQPEATGILLWVVGVLPVVALAAFLKKLWRTWRGK
jgi:hypothetical protein